MICLRKRGCVYVNCFRKHVRVLIGLSRRENARDTHSNNPYFEPQLLMSKHLDFSDLRWYSHMSYGRLSSEGKANQNWGISAKSTIGRNNWDFCPCQCLVTNRRKARNMYC